MENQPHNNRSEDSKDKSDGKSKESSDFGYTNVYSAPVERPVYETPAPQVERHIPLAPAFEGIISWRDEDAEKSVAEKEAKDKEKDKKEGEKSEKQPTVLPGVTEERPKPPVFPELQQPVPEQAVEDEATSEDEDSVSSVSDNPQAPLPTSPNEYPQYAHEQKAEVEEQPDRPVPTLPLQPTSPQSRIDNPIPAEQYAPHSVANPGEFAPLDPVYTSEAQEPEPSLPPMLVPPAVPDFMRPAAEQTQQWTDPSEVVPSAATLPEQHDTVLQPADYGQVEQTPLSATDESVEIPTSSPLQPESSPAYHPGHDPYLNPPQGSEYAGAASGVPAMPIEHPNFNTNRDPRVGPVAALLGLEYIGRKRADRKLERKMNKQIQNTAKEQERRTTAEYQRMQEQQRQVATEQQWQSAEMRRTQQVPAPSQERYPAPAAAAAPASYETPGQFQPQPFETPQPLRANPGMRAEQQPQQPRIVNPEARPAVPVSVAAAAEQQSQDLAEQPFELKPNEHVEHSAWHNIVVDDRGHEVAGAINYGEGFQRERQQELRQDPPPDQGGTTAGSMNGAMGQAPQFGMPYPGALPSGITAPSLPQGQPTRADSQHQLEAQNNKKEVASNIANPWFWIMLLLIIAAFFTAAAV